MDKYSILFYEYLTGCGLKQKTIKRMKCFIKKFYEWLSNKDIREIKEVDIIELAKYLYSIKSQYGKVVESGKHRMFFVMHKKLF